MANPHAWFLSDLKNVPSNGFKVMSTFACGGGSSMGYKRAGYDVIAANDIDPEMAWHYKRNLNPKHYFLCPIRNLLTAPLPDELFDLDVLDGSPPCSTFSMAGSREKTWGREKHFREGQAKQVLSDLFFDFLDLAERLKPKVIIAENVKGMILGNAKGYVKLIFDRMREMGYRPQLFLINAADCGVPQRRERTFFCAVHGGFGIPLLDLRPCSIWVPIRKACCDLQVLTGLEKQETAPSVSGKRFYHLTMPGDNYSKACEKQTGKTAFFNYCRTHSEQPVVTLTAASATRSMAMHWSECRQLTFREWKRLGSFPDDYEAKSDKIGKHLIGMSVPPKMTEYVAREVARQWLEPMRNRQRQDAV